MQRKQLEYAEWFIHHHFHHSYVLYRRLNLVDPTLRTYQVVQRSSCLWSIYDLKPKYLSITDICLFDLTSHHQRHRDMIPDTYGVD
jgi:hypothetical protein